MSARTIIAGFLLIAATTLLDAAPARAQGVTNEQIDEAIKKAVDHIWSKQQADGYWPHHMERTPAGAYRSNTGSIFEYGETVMAALALENNNTPLDDPKYQRVIKLVMEIDTKNNYLRSCRTIMLAHLYGRMPDSRRPGIRLAMKADVAHFVAAQFTNGGWRYDDKPKNIDLSNTQLVVLALSEAAKCGVEIPRDTIAKAHKLLMELQRPDGGWNYSDPESLETRPSHGSMAAAGVASLMLTTEMLTGGAGCPCQMSKSPVPKTDSEEAITRGMAWMNTNFTARRHPGHDIYYYYWLYQAERVGIAGGLRYFGTNDWYLQGAAALVGKQGAEGSFGTIPDTAFAVLFLTKGRGTVIYNKLQFEGDWNLHRYDMRNLSNYIGQAKELNALWQVIQSSSPVSVWHDAPVLFITSEGGFKPDDELKKKLRQYTDNGGTLLIEASCGNPAAKKMWGELIREIWPEWELKAVDKDHPVWSSDKNMRGRVANLEHLNDGVRSIIFYSPMDISCHWHTNNVARQLPLYEFGMNLPMYASDKAPLRLMVSGPMVRPGRGLPGQTPAAPAGAKITMARLTHEGDPYIGRHYRGLEKLAEFLTKTVKLETAVGEDIDAANADALKGCNLLWISGRKSVSLSAAQQAGLKAHLEGGGFLVSEAVMGDPAYNEAFSKTAEGLGLTMKPLAPVDDLLKGKLGTASGYDVSSGMIFTRAIRIDRAGKDHADLVGLYMGDKLVGVHSPLDVLIGLTGASAWDRRGYESDSAMAVAVNLVLRAAAAK